MTKIIAILFMIGQFQVAVETSQGYLVATYPDTESGVAQFMETIRSALAADSGRFYTCGGYNGPTDELLQSQLAKRIGVANKIQTGRRDPGIANAPWIVRNDHIKTYLAGQSTEKLDAKLVEKMCVSLLPKNYMQLYPAKTDVSEFYR